MIGLVLSCEHASWTLPTGFDLGVSRDVLQSQAGWDHGALDVIAPLSEAVGLPVHTGAFSRMFVDLNRAADHPDVVPLVSFGAEVPGNAELSSEERARRLATFHAPYWNGVRTDVLARMRDRGRVFHFSSHSFDPDLDPEARAFDVGVLYDPMHAFETLLAERLLLQLREAGLDVRANEPYDGIGPAITSSLREELGAPYAGIQLEVSHAVTSSQGGPARVAAAILPFLEALEQW